MRYFIHLCYHGKNYSGWQVQPNAISVQEMVNTCMSTLLGQTIDVVGAGRTDAGVHAKSMYAHFDAEPILDKAKLVHRMNKFLKEDIAVYDILEVRNDAHARFDASWRSYEYWISKGKNPFLRGLSWQSYFHLNIENMNEAARTLFDFEDFTSFARLHSDVKNHICKLKYAHWEENNDAYIFKVTANRFLRNMVRAMVGTMVEVGKGQMDTNEFKNVLIAKDRARAGASAPAEGLFLTEIIYPKEIFHV